MRVIACVFFLFYGIGLFGQNSSFGVRAGVNRAQLKPHPLAKNTNYRFVGGITYLRQFSPKNSVNIDLLYSQKGIENELHFTDDNAQLLYIGKLSYNFNYLSLPVKYGYYFGDKGTVFTKFGLVPSFILSANAVIKADEYEGDKEDSFKDEVMSVDLAGVIEFGVYLKKYDNSSFYLSAGVNRSLIKAFDIDYERESPKHFVIDISLGFQLNRNNQ